MAGLPIQAHSNWDADGETDNAPDKETDQTTDVRHLSIPRPSAPVKRKPDADSDDKANNHPHNQTYEKHVSSTKSISCCESKRFCHLFGKRYGCKEIFGVEIILT